MPQPALHLLLARESLDHWHADGGAPFDISQERAVNAFLHGSLAPDMGNFPGGRTELARAIHTCRSGDMQRTLIESARTVEEKAFAWGWLTHVIADVLVHPLVNNEAARRNGGTASLVEHVRVEVGIDAWFCWQHASLDGIRLTNAFDGPGYGFLSRAIRDVLDLRISTLQLTQMERGLMMFSHGALYFATSLARHLCWGEPVAATPSLGSTAFWHAASRLSPRNTVVHAYLNPHQPDAALLERVAGALDQFHTMLDRFVSEGVADLPDYNLEDGTISEADAARRVA